MWNTLHRLVSTQKYFVAVISFLVLPVIDICLLVPPVAVPSASQGHPKPKPKPAAPKDVEHATQTGEYKSFVVVISFLGFPTIDIYLSVPLVAVPSVSQGHPKPKPKPVARPITRAQTASNSKAGNDENESESDEIDELEDDIVLMKKAGLKG